MKYPKLPLSLSLLLIALPASAQQSALQAATEHEISAQINVTRDRTALLLQKVGRTSGAGTVSSSDYSKFKRELRDRVEAGLMRYEANLKNDVLNRVALWMDRYNAIHASPDYPAEQKKIVLQQQLTLIQPQMAKISVLYRKYIAEVYALAGPIPMRFGAFTAEEFDEKNYECNLGREMRKMYKHRTFVLHPTVVLLDGSEHGRFDYCAISKNYSSRYGGYEEYHVLGRPSPEPYDFRYSFRERSGLSSRTTSEQVSDFSYRVFPEITYPAIRKHCRSQICISLTASDLMLFLSSVVSGIDQDLVFKLADGSAVRLTAGALPDGQGNFAFQQLIRTDYPAEFQTLPYDTQGQ